VREARKHGLPSFSPDLNPIEKLWRNTEEPIAKRKDSLNDVVQ